MSATATGANETPAPMGLITAVTTEHFTLQTARSGVISDSSTRANQFLTTLSATLVALAFVAQVTQRGSAFYAFALTVLPVMIFLGVATVLRVIQLSVEDQLYGLAIARLRGYYAEIAADRHGLFLLAQAHNAEQRADAALADLGGRKAAVQTLVATPGSLAVVTAVLVGGTAAVAAQAAGARLTIAIGVGVTAAVGVSGALLHAANRAFARAQAGLIALSGDDPTSPVLGWSR